MFSTTTIYLMPKCFAKKSARSKKWKLNIEGSWNVIFFNAFRSISHPYFDVVVGFARSYDPESYAGGSLLLVGFPMPDRSKVMTQTKRDALALQVGGQ